MPVSVGSGGDIFKPRPLELGPRRANNIVPLCHTDLPAIAMAGQICSSEFYFSPPLLRGDHVTLAGCDIISPETAKTRNSSPPKKQRGSFSPLTPHPPNSTGPPTAVTVGAPVRLLGKMVSLFSEGERCLRVCTA